MKRLNAHMVRAALLSVLLLPATAAAQGPTDIGAADATSETGPIYSQGCSLSAELPKYQYTASNGAKVVRFWGTYSCRAGVTTLQVEHEVWDDDTLDGTASDLLEKVTHGPAKLSTVGYKGTYRWDVEVHPFDGASDPIVELFNRIRWRVCSGATCGWSHQPGIWVKSPILKFYV